MEVKFYEDVEDELPEDWTYPLIQPVLIGEFQRRIQDRKLTEE